MKTKRVFVVAAVFALVFTPGAFAQDAYPARPIRFVVPFVPGGPSDIQSRLIAEKLRQRLGQPVIVDNRGGAGGTIGMEIAAKAPGNGYTLVIGSVGTWAVNPHLYRLTYDSVKDFAPIIQVSTSPGGLFVHPSVPANNVKELVTLATNKPGQLNYGSSGVGGFGHISGELFTAMTKIKMTHVPYKSSTPALTDLMSGQIQVLFNNLLATFPHLKSGKLRAIATTGVKRASSLPDLPTVAESGVPGYQSSGWWAVAAPARTPQRIIARLNKELAEILRLPDIREKYEAVGAEVVGGTPEQFHTYLKAEIEKFGKLVKEAGIKSAEAG